MERVKLSDISVIVLFITSYIPLFGLLILRQIKQNFRYLHFANFTPDSMLTACRKFGLSFALLVIITLGYIGLRLLLKNLSSRKQNGEIVKITRVENKNSESIGYISTYIVPFIFQDTNDIFDIISVFIVLGIIFIIYVKSSMIVINPILGMTHTLYSIDYSKKSYSNTVFLITTNAHLERGQEVKINLITNNIYYG